VRIEPGIHTPSSAPNRGTTSPQRLERTQTVTEPKFAPLTELLGPSRLQPINLRVKSCLIEEARRHNVNISEVLCHALFQHLRQLRRERWLAESFPAIATYNRRVDDDGLLLDVLNNYHWDE
jgi:post-segregation antitoxin (ccd killing protein)